MAKSNNSGLVMAIVFASVVLAGSLVFLGKQIGEDPMMAEARGSIHSPTELAGDTLAALADDDAVKGNPNAPVTIVEFSDFECPYCQAFYQNTLPRIQQKYINSGLVKLVYRDYPLSGHAGAEPAAIAAECAREQGGDDMYYNYHDAIFDKGGSMTGELLRSFAAGLNLDLGAFDACVGSGKYTAEVQADLQQAYAIGVRGTPAFVINGQGISGNRPYETFEYAIDAALEKALKDSE